MFMPEGNEQSKKQSPEVLISSLEKHDVSRSQRKNLVNHDETVSRELGTGWI